METAFSKNTRPALIQAYEAAWLELLKEKLSVVPRNIMMDHFAGFILKYAEEKGLFTAANAVDLLAYFKNEPVKRMESVERLLVLAIREKPDLGPVVFDKLVDAAYQDGFLFDYQYCRLLGAVAREMALKERAHPALFYEVRDGLPNIDVFVVNKQNMPTVLFNQHPDYVSILPEKLLSNCDLNIGEHWPKYKNRINASLRLLFSFTKDEVNGAIRAVKEKPGLNGAALAIENWRVMAQQIVEYPRLQRELDPDVRKMLQAYAPAPK